MEKLKKTSDWHQGYCYQFWRCRHNAFRGDGAFGQFMIVMPDQEAVIVITSQTADLQNELNLVWDHLLPAIQDITLPTDPEAQAQLGRELGSLALPLPHGNAASPVADKISANKFQIEPNAAGVQTVSFLFQREDCTFTLTDGNGQNAVRCGLGQWVDGECNVPGTPPKITVGDLRPCKIAASACWKDDDTLEMIWRYYETPHHDTVTCHFKDSNVTVEFMNSIPGHKETRPVLRGQA